MGASFVLKDAQGGAAGYLMQGMNRIRCRMQGKSGDMAVLLFFEDGTNKRHELKNPAQEHEWQDEGRKLCGAVVVSQGHIAADSGEAARRLFEAEKRRERAKRAGESRKEGERQSGPESMSLRQIDEPEPRSVEQMALAVEEIEKPGYGWPQRRWPPPPCLPHAVYREGQWI